MSNPNKRFMVTGNGFIKVTDDGKTTRTLYYSKVLFNDLLRDGYTEVFDSAT